MLAPIAWMAAAAVAGDYADVLTAAVKRDGVDYVELRRQRGKVERHVRSLEKADAGAAKPLAFWIDAYNALTLHRVLETIPESGPYSVRDVEGFWTKRTWEVAGRKVTLDLIEHEILRKELRDPRIHFAINCASRSCPPLAPVPYAEAADLDQALSRAARAYLADRARNRFDAPARTAELSQLFE
ncbi:MAG: DUF547 domain-containing protein, partial [Planctomycetota bacterium]